MVTTSTNDAPAKKIKTVELPDGLFQLTTVNFRIAVKVRLECDAIETMDVVVAYSVVLDENDVSKIFCLEKSSLDHGRFWYQSRKAFWILANFKQTREKDCAPEWTAADRRSSNIVLITYVIFSHLSFIE
jgi:hypothetical protein